MQRWSFSAESNKLFFTSPASPFSHHLFSALPCTCYSIDKPWVRSSPYAVNTMNITHLHCSLTPLVETPTCCSPAQTGSAFWWSLLSHVTLLCTFIWARNVSKAPGSVAFLKQPFKPHLYLIASHFKQLLARHKRKEKSKKSKCFLQSLYWRKSAKIPLSPEDITQSVLTLKLKTWIF